MVPGLALLMIFMLWSTKSVSEFDNYYVCFVCGMV
jgi:hypothetical protein